VNTVFRANTSDALLQALESGIGIGGMQRPLVARALQAGTLVPVLPDWRLPDRFLYAVILTPALFRSASERSSA
jgi:DNA-binding transcriptional LysR family regulator